LEPASPRVAPRQSRSATTRLAFAADESAGARHALPLLLFDDCHSVGRLGAGVVLPAWPAHLVFRPLQLAAYSVSCRASARAEEDVESRILHRAHVSRLLGHCAPRAAHCRCALSPVTRGQRAAPNAARDKSCGQNMKRGGFLVFIAIASAASPASATHWTVDYGKSRLGFTAQWSGEPFSAEFK